MIELGKKTEIFGAELLEVIPLYHAPDPGFLIVISAPAEAS